MIYGLRKYTLALLVILLTLVSGILFKDAPLVLGEVLASYAVAYGLYLDYNVKSKNVELTKK